MPFSIRKSGNEYCVVNSDTGDKKGCHPTKAKAVQQLKALYANVPEAGKKDFNGWVYEYQIDQADAEYDPIGGMTGGEACANCRHFDSPNGCLIVRGDISPVGHSRFWEAIPVYTPEPMPVEITNWAEQGQSGSNPEILAVARKWWDSLWNDNKPARVGNEAADKLKPIYLTKDIDGRMQAHMLMSNNFEDRTGQTVPEAVHQETINWIRRTGLYPEFQVWHMGTKSRWGQADHIDRIGNFTLVSGPVDPGKELLAEAFAKDPNTGVSNGYYAIYTPDRKDFLAWYPFEASALPLSHTANVWSCDALALESEGFLLDPQYKATLIAKGFDEKFIDEMEKDIITRGQRAAAQGVGSKSTEGETPATPPAVTGLDANTTLLINAVGTAIGKALEPITARLGVLEEGQKSITKQQEKSQDDLVADQILARVGTASVGFKATESSDNVPMVIDPNSMPDQALTPKQEWLNEQLEGVLAQHGLVPAKGSN